MTDQLERYLRDEFEDDASRAPGLGSVAGGRLAAVVQDGVRRSRRRRLAIGAAGGLVVLIAVPLSVLSGQSDRRGAEPAVPEPAASAPVTPRPTGPFEPVADGTLQFRGITVEVPQAMLEKDRRRCGASLMDAAWWEDKHTATRSCLIDIPTDGLNEVSLRGVGKDERVSATPSRRVLEDGRTKIVVGFPDRDVVLTVVSPLARRADYTVESAREIPAEGQIDGCGITPRIENHSLPLRGGTPAMESILGAEATGGAVCGYRGGWLVEGRALTGSEARRVASEIRTRGGDHTTTRDCMNSDTFDSVGFWFVRLLADGGPPVEATVTPGGCVDGDAGVTDDGRTFGLTDPLAQLLNELAAGPVRW